jgi:hypothetical protein
MSDIQTLSLRLTGKPGSLLCVHSFSEKARAEIRIKQQKGAKKAKMQRDPNAEFLVARYVDEAGRECVPCTAVKKSLISAATAMDNLTKVALRQAVFVAPSADPASMLVPIQRHDGTPAIGVMREDAVTLGLGTRGLTYRPAYAEWVLHVVAEFNTRLVSKEQLLMLAQQAGWGVGICEGRPERSSALGWGRFDVAEVK